MKNVIIGNWKMNKVSSEIEEFFKDLKKLLKNVDLIENLEFGVAVPACYLEKAKQASLKLKTDFIVASEDVSQHLSGAFTGEISSLMLNDLGITHSIIGHSERRMYHGETNEIVNKKAKILLEKGITPIICVGETLKEFESKKSEKVVEKQIKESLKDIDSSKVIIAYEPVWAIGTGKVATIEYAQNMCKFIRSLTSKKTPIQYGGSVTPDNIKELLKQKDINGALVGGAALKVDSFVKLIEK